ncbi:hypothetical protein F5883DRAFT_556427 [Diaporthe sp. PMI_573]|nr:hypothetical protein F5883DRAFT_556427 [Diaporthaceae sp. PMI_573]
MVSTTTNPDSELFCSVSSTQKVPERHPSTLIPGGHASPLRHPTVLRPGAGNHHARKPSSETPKTPAQHHQRTPSTTPKPAYKAYSPPATPQDPRASVVADEIEGFFTALDIQPLHIKKQDAISSPSSAGSGRASPDIQRCASPPLPPKVKLEEPQQQLSPPAEVSPASEPETKVQDEDSDSDLPPAYDESERVQAPPEKPAATTETQEPEEPASTSTPTLASSAAMSAAKVGGSVAGVDTDEAAAKDTTEEAKPETQADSEESTTEEQPQQTIEDASPTDASPPPLPPRPTASTSTTPQPDTAAQMPGAFPPPPRRSPSPKGHSSSSSYSKMTYIPGAAATSATAVGAAVAIPSTDFAHGGLAHARKALGQRVSHLIDKAKEHHEARKGAAASRGGAEEGKKENVMVVAPMIGA